MKVWRALTTQAMIAKWLMPNDFVPAVGHRFNFRMRPRHDWDGIARVIAEAA